MCGCRGNHKIYISILGDVNTIAVKLIELVSCECVVAVKSETKSALRRAQLNKAFNGDTAMLIWLGKNWLKQSDSGERLSDENQVLPWQD